MQGHGLGRSDRFGLPGDLLTGSQDRAGGYALKFGSLSAKGLLKGVSHAAGRCEECLLSCHDNWLQLIEC